MDSKMKTAHDITARLRTDDVLNEENINVDFASLLLSGPVLDGLQCAGFQRPSPIQLKAIPLGRCGLDLVIQAKSGTGKTCVFSVIALESLDISSNATQVLILAPTREIAVQIQQVILDIGQKMAKLRCHAFIGGTLIGPDKQNLKKCHIAVGTPGRVKQLIETGLLVTDHIRMFILDEADKLLDDKFQSQINWIYNELPYSKQILAASATYPEFLAQHLTSYMRDATFVRLNTREIALHGIRQYYKLVEGHEIPHKSFALKVNDLINLLSSVTFQQCLVFSNLHTRAENLCDILCQRGWPSMFISGGLEQKQRLHAMSTFKKFECRVLISTDLTARGIDAEKVNLVINLDVPVDVKTYLHRIGRAGRFGTYGASITLASYGREELLLHSIQKESHVPMLSLPDPVPSDLLSLNSGEVITATRTEDHISNLNDDYSCDKIANDTQQYNSKSNQPKLPAFHVDRQAGDSGSYTGLNGRVHSQDVLRSADSTITKTPVKEVTMCDKDCQTIDPNSVFNIITSDIPSLADTLDLRRNCPKWSFSEAMKDFKHFINTGKFELYNTGTNCKDSSIIDDLESISHSKDEVYNIGKTCKDSKSKDSLVKMLNSKDEEYNTGKTCKDSDIKDDLKSIVHSKDEVCNNGQTCKNYDIKDDLVKMSHSKDVVETINDFKQFKNTGEVEVNSVETYKNSDIKPEGRISGFKNDKSADAIQKRLHSEHNQNQNKEIYETDKFQSIIVEDVQHHEFEGEIKTVKMKKEDHNNEFSISEGTDNTENAIFYEEGEKTHFDSSFECRYVQKTKPFKKKNKDYNETEEFQNGIKEGIKVSELEKQLGSEDEQQHISWLPISKLINTTEKGTSCDEGENSKCYFAKTIEQQDEPNKPECTKHLEGALKSRQAYRDNSEYFGETSMEIPFKKFSRNKDEVMAFRENQDVRLEEVSNSEDVTSCKKIWIEDDRNEQEEDGDWEEEYTSLVGLNKKTATSVTDCKHKNSSNIFIIKDGVVVRISSEDHETRQNTVTKEFDSSSTSGSLANESPGMLEEQPNIVGRKEKIIRNKRQQKQWSKKSGGSCHNSSYNECSGFASNFNSRKVKDTQSWYYDYTGSPSCYYDTQSSYYGYNYDYSDKPLYDNYYDYSGYKEETTRDKRQQKQHRGKAKDNIDNNSKYYSDYSCNPSYYYNTNTHSSYYDYNYYYSGNPYYNNGAPDSYMPYQNNYDYNGYSSYYNSCHLPDSQHQTSHMGYPSGWSYYNTGGWPVWSYY